MKDPQAKYLPFSNNSNLETSKENSNKVFKNVLLYFSTYF